MSKKPGDFIDVAGDLYNKFNLFSKTTILGLAERLNNRYTVFLLALSMAFAIPNNYIDSRITCFALNTPNQKGSFMDLFENYCYTNGTILLFPEDPTPTSKDEWNRVSETKKINYYQWFFVMLLIQICLFKIPNRIWHCISSMQSEINLEGLIEKADKSRRETDSSKYENSIEEIAMEIDKILVPADNEFKYQNCFSKKKKQITKIFCHSDKKLTSTFTIVKFIYLANLVLQLFLMYKFMFNSTLLPSFSFLHRPGQVDSVFPRNVMCHMPNVMGSLSVNSYTGQCILYLNMYNQVVYTVIYYWLTFVSVITVGSIPLFILKAFNFQSHYDLVKQLLRISSSYSRNDKEIIKDFIKSYLGCDGVFVIRKLNDNVNHWVGSDVVTVMFNNFKQKILRGAEQ